VATSTLIPKCAATLNVDAEKTDEVKVLQRQTYARMAPDISLSPY
jgi:hypothetical protein